jgi:hypothetical protein
VRALVRRDVQDCRVDVLRRLADQASVEQRVGQCFLRQVRVCRGDSGEGSMNSFMGISRKFPTTSLCTNRTHLVPFPPPPPLPSY